MNIDPRMAEKEPTLYGWAFVVGDKILTSFESIYGLERAVKKMETVLLNLRSELIPERFKRSLIDTLIEAGPEVGLREEIREERRWNVDEFYRYSTAILAGFFDALQKRKRKAESEGAKEEPKQRAGGTEGSN